MIEGITNKTPFDLEIEEGDSSDSFDPSTDPAYIKVTLLRGPYSPSRLIAGKCPEFFFGRYIQKEKTSYQAMEAARGLAIHDIFANIINYKKIHNSNPPINDIKTWCYKVIGKYPAAYEQSTMIEQAALKFIAVPCRYHFAQMETEVPVALYLYEKEDPNGGASYKSWKITTEVDSTGRPPKDVFFWGKADIVHIDHDIKVVTIVDYKSTPSTSVNEDMNFQIGSYAWLFSKMYPGYRIETALYFCHPDIAHWKAPTVWNEDDLRDMENYIISKIFALEHFTDFPALPGDHCGKCHRIQSCGAYTKFKDMYSRGDINLNVDSFADLAPLAEQLLLVETMEKTLKKALKKGIEKHAPVGGIHLEGCWYGFKSSSEAIDWIETDRHIQNESERARIRLENGDYTPEIKPILEQRAGLQNLAAIFQKFDIDPKDFQEWSGNKIKKLWTFDKPELLDMLKEYQVSSRSTRFGQHKY